MRGPGRIAGLVFVGALVVRLGAACSDESSGQSVGAPDGATSQDGSSATSDATADASVEAATLPPLGSCPEACAIVKASAACADASFDETSCTNFCSCAVNGVRPEISQAVLTCVADCRPTGLGEDKCISDVAAPYYEDPEVKSVVETCLAKSQGCKEAGTSLGTDVCFILPARVEYIAKFKDCLTLSCSEGRTCIAAVATEFGCGE